MHAYTHMYLYIYIYIYIKNQNSKKIKLDSKSNFNWSPIVRYVPRLIFVSSELLSEKLKIPNPIRF